MNIAVIFAGGVGRRMHSRDLPKQFLVIHDKPIIVHTIEYFQRCDQIDAIAVVCVKEWIAHFQSLAEHYGLDKVKMVVPGGETGQLSIFEGLKAAKQFAGEREAIVLIHDGVRPLITDELLLRNIEDTEQYGSSITSGNVTETVVEVSDDMTILHVSDRTHSRVAKAPQCFRLKEIYEAHLRALNEGKKDFIDSCTLMQFYGFRLHMTDGPIENIKITTPMDYFTMRAILQAREDSQFLRTEECGKNGVG